MKLLKRNDYTTEDVSFNIYDYTVNLTRVSLCKMNGEHYCLILHAKCQADIRAHFGLVCF